MVAARRGNRFLFMTLMVYIIGSLILSAYAQYTQKTFSTVYMIVLSQWGIVFLPIVIYFVVTRSPLKQTLLLRKIKWFNVLFSVLLAWSILPLLAFLNVLSQFFVKNQIADVITQILDQPLWLILLIMAVTPAIIEEIAMRSIIISNYRNKSVLTTCIISGFFFGMFHMNINQFVYAFAMGAIMCFVVHLTGSILASMIIHFTINATNLIWAKLSLILMDYMSKIDPKYAEQATQTLDTKMLVIACIVIFCVCVLFAPINWLIIRALMKYNKLEHILSSHMTTAEVLKLPVMETPFSDKIVTPSFIMSIGIFLIFSVGVEFILPVFGF